MRKRGMIVHLCDTWDGYGVYVSQRAYGTAKGMRPFIFCSDYKSRVFKVYLNRDDREEAIGIWESRKTREKLNLLGRYRKLRSAEMVHTEKGWKKK